jgi:hypothetical protein
MAWVKRWHETCDSERITQAFALTTRSTSVNRDLLLITGLFPNRRRYIHQRATVSGARLMLLDVAVSAPQTSTQSPVRRLGRVLIS